MAQILLHGTLHATIFEVDRLKTSGGNILTKLVQNIEETVGFGKGVAKLYATIDLEKARVGRTRIIEKEHTNPRWYESFHIYCAHKASHIIFTVKDENAIGAALIGRAYVPVEEVLNGKEIDRWLEILDEHKNPIHGHWLLMMKKLGGTSLTLEFTVFCALAILIMVQALFRT